jgi:hypothetical protein
MSEGMWDGGAATRCPHGNFLSLGDAGPCGCCLRIVMADDKVIHPGPYDPNNPRDPMYDRRPRVGPRHPEGTFSRRKA